MATLSIVASFSAFQNFNEADRQKFLNLRLKPLVEDGKEPRDIAPAIARSLSSPNATDAQYQRLLASMAALHKGSYIKALKATSVYDRAANLDKIAVPTLLIFGEADTLTTADMGRQMNERIKGSRLVIVPKSGHLVNIEQPDAFAAALEPFLFEHRGRADVPAAKAARAAAKVTPAVRQTKKKPTPKRRRG